MLSSTATGVAVTPHTALSIADALACVRVLAESAASLPLIVYRRSGEGRVRVQEGRLTDLLTRPAPATTQANLVGQLVAHLNLHGEGFLALYRDELGEVAQLGLLAPERMVVEILGGQPFYGYTDELGRQATLSDRDVIHVRGLTVDGVRGLSPVSAAREALGLSAALAEQAARTVANDSRPSGILRLGHGAEDRLQGLADAWRQRHGGPENAGRIAVVTGDVEWVGVSMSAADAQFLEQRQLSTQEVARVFRVPPWMVGAPSGDSMTYSNVESQALAFTTYSLRPWLTVIEQALSAHPDLCPPGSGLYVEFLLDALLRADSATRAAVYTAALNPVTGWMNRDEVRRAENLPAEQRSAPAASEGTPVAA